MKNTLLFMYIAVIIAVIGEAVAIVTFCLATKYLNVGEHKKALRFFSIGIRCNFIAILALGYILFISA